MKAAPPLASKPELWPLSGAAYRALGDLGLIPENTELLYGQVYRKMSKTPLHSFLTGYLEDGLRAAVPIDCHVRGEEPLAIGDSEPEPDLAVVKGRREDYRAAHPMTAELVIEVCVSSHDYDRSKLRAYAAAGVKEVWMILAPEKQIEIFRQPTGDHYASRTAFGPGGTVTSLAVPGFGVDLARLFA